MSSVRQTRFAYAEQGIGSYGRSADAVAKNDPDGDTQLDNALIYLEHLSATWDDRVDQRLAESRITT